MPGFDAQNKNILDAKFICHLCSFILRDPVQLLDCGHRFCHSCLHIQHQSNITCSQCHTTTTTDQIIPDRGFTNDMMRSLAVICSQCNWAWILQNYQEHLDQLHHHASACQQTIVHCLLHDYGCDQQIVRGDLSDHYRSEQHQQSIVNVVERMMSQLRDVQMTSTDIDTDGHRTTTTSAASSAMEQLEELNETINTFANGSQVLGEDAERNSGEQVEHENRLQSLMEHMSKVKMSVEEACAFLEGVKQNVEILQQDLSSLEEKMDDMQYVSYDGTFTWKISELQEKMNDAKSERQTSIYSPPFYSSPTGYKMRARLYLNGDGNARRTHMSLFFVLMRGRNDAILKFPFNYKVTFCLYDQTPQLRHIIDSFRPDIRSNSFQRPRSEMNIASGIPKFFPLAMIEQEGNPYVRDDTMFIRVMIDFGDMPKTLLPYTLSLNPGFLTTVQQDMINEEAQRRTSLQTTEQHP